MSLRNRILAVTIPINIIAILCIYFIVKSNANKTVEQITNKHTVSLLNSAMLTIENQYTSLEYHREYATNLRKKERQQIVKIAISLIQELYDEYQEGKLTETQAKQMAFQIIDNLRYDYGSGYIWINNTEKPIPRIIYHPIYPEFNNKISTDPIFYTSHDSSNIPRLAADLCETKGSGFIEYLWRKPELSDDTIYTPKTSYVDLFEPWQWVLGTGIYLEDIDQDVARRLDAILEELKQTMGTMHLGQTGYFFIFDSNKDLVLHPIAANLDSDSVESSLLDNAPFNEIMDVANKGINSFEYEWYSPLSDLTTDDQRKKVFVEYFEPLDWYVCASFYHSELEAPGVQLGRNILFISAIFILISVLAIFYLANSLTKPLNRLMKVVAEFPGNFQNLNPDKIPASFRSYEASALGRVIKNMILSIKEQQEKLIEEKKKAEENEARSRDSEEKFRKLYEASNDAIFLIKGNEIISCNQRTLELFKCSEQEIIGAMPSALSPEKQYDGESSVEIEKEILSEVSEGKRVVFEWKHLRPNGEYFDSVVSLNFVELNNERYTQATVRDITERKQNEQELENYRNNLEKLVESRTQELNAQNKTLKQTLQDLKEAQSQLIHAEKMASLGILTAGVAHEINNPVNFIQNGTYALKMAFEREYPQNQETYKPIFDAILTGVKRISEIVKSLGKYSRTQKDDIGPCYIHEILDNCLTMLFNQYKHRIEIERNYTQHLPVIFANEGELHQAFLNILYNAIQAIDENGVITIDTLVDHDSLQINIKDTGKGIKNEDLKHIFDPFFTTKEAGQGTGLGLSITKKLIENHNGTINCKSEVGKSTTFYVSLPVNKD